MYVRVEQAPGGPTVLKFSCSEQDPNPVQINLPAGTLARFIGMLDAAQAGERFFCATTVNAELS